MTRTRGELPDAEEELLGIERPTEEEEAEAERELQQKAEVRRAFLFSLMQSVAFREWLMEQLVSAGTFEHRFGGSPTGFPDPMGTQYAMGMKQTGWNIWEQFDNVAPDLTSLMRREWSRRRPT